MVYSGFLAMYMEEFLYFPYIFVCLYGKQFEAGMSAVVDILFSYLMHNGIYHLFGVFLVFLKPVFYRNVAHENVLHYSFTLDLIKVFSDNDRMFSKLI